MAKTALLLALVAVLVGGLFVAGCVTGTPGNITVVTSTPAGTTPATTAPITTGTPAEVVTAVAPLTTAPTENITAPNTTATVGPNATANATATPTAVRTSYMEQDSDYTGGSSGGQVVVPVTTVPSARRPSRLR